MTAQPHIIIIGGGIAGLSTAWYLQQQAPTAHITLIEQAERVGGKVRTDQINVDNQHFVIEGGPDSFIIQKPWAAQLCKELGLASECITTEQYSQNIYTLHKGKPIALPKGIMLMVPTDIGAFLRSPLISWPGKMRMALDFILPKRKQTTDESLGQFVRRRLGKEALDKIAEPMMAGIYNAESERQSLQATFPRFLELEQTHRSIIWGMIKSRAAQRQPQNQPTSPFRALRGGMQTMIDSLKSQLNIDLRTGTAVSKLEPYRERGGYRLTLSDGSELHADATVLAIPAYSAATLVEPWAAELAQDLRNIRYVSTGTISLAYHKSDLNLPIEGYGLVIPNSEGRKINACTITSRKFTDRASDDHVLIRVFFGGSRHPEVYKLADSDIEALVKSELRSIFGISAAPIWSGIYRWPNANPQYDTEHLAYIDSIEAQCPAGLFLTGSAYRGVGIPDCVHQAQQTAEHILESLIQPHTILE